MVVVVLVGDGGHINSQWALFGRSISLMLSFMVSVCSKGRNMSQ